MVRGPTAALRALEMVSAQAVTTTEQHIVRANQVAELVAGMAESATRALNALAAQQERLNSSGLRGVEDLQLRLLELNGTEAEIARARHERDEAQIRRQIALMKLDAERAALAGDHAESDRLREEIRLYERQLTLLDQLFLEEEKQRRKKELERAREKVQEKARGSSGSGGGGSTIRSTGGAATTPAQVERASVGATSTQGVRPTAGATHVLGVYRIELKNPGGGVTPINVAAPSDVQNVLRALEVAREVSS